MRLLVGTAFSESSTDLAQQVVASYTIAVTDSYAVAYRVENERAARYSNFPPAAPSPALGATKQSFGAGMLYRFSVAHQLGEK